MKLVLMLVLLILCQIQAQQKFAVVIEDKHAIVKKMLFEGSYIVFKDEQNQEFDGIIKRIKPDTVFIEHYRIINVPTYWGGIKIDTVNKSLQAYPINFIKKILLQTNEGYARNFTLSMLFIGATGYTVLNVVNGMYLKEPIFYGQNLSKLIIASSIAISSFVLNKIWPPNGYSKKRDRIKIFAFN